MSVEQKIQNILDGNFTRGDNAKALKELLALHNSTPRYSVSLVFVNTRENLLRCLITDASNEYEALGKALDHFKEETKDFNLSMKVVLPVYNISQQPNIIT